MEMDKGEIAVSFRLAKDKKAQIKMLADLNLCSPWHIATLLDDMGELRQYELTPPAALKAPLRINGALVMEIARIVIHGARDETPSVEIVTEVG